jgi:hypothetical protein
MQPLRSHGPFRGRPDSPGTGGLSGPGKPTVRRGHPHEAISGQAEAPLDKLQAELTPTHPFRSPAMSGRHGLPKGPADLPPSPPCRSAAFTDDDPCPPQSLTESGLPEPLPLTGPSLGTSHPPGRPPHPILHRPPMGFPPTQIPLPLIPPTSQGSTGLAALSSPSPRTLSSHPIADRLSLS